MELFFELEIVYLIIGAFIMTVTAIVTTREFMPKVAFKRGMLLVGGLLVLMIGFHHYMTITRMAGVKEIFNEGGTIICENKMRRTVSRSVLLSKNLGWSLDRDEFVNPEYERNFHTSRCIEYDGIVPK
ncbi:MAG: hypothetical protein U9N33_03145 [Campylobacterota bacterium]|nr:hypothetical protein [Campylobacterota bacterium]